MMRCKTVIGIMVFGWFLTACTTPIATTTPGVMTEKTTATSSKTISQVKLLFVYSPGCSHCAYQTPIVMEFGRKYSHVEVTQVKYTDLNPEQKGLITGISGHPIMVFYDGDHVRRIVGETPMDALEEEYQAFRDQPGEATRSTVTTGSYSI